MDIVVFGAGSLGSLVGGLLARTHEVTLVGRDPHMRTVSEGGLRISGLVDTRVFPEAVTDGTGLSADLAVVTVKTADTDEAAAALGTGDYEAVLSLQNGLTEERLASRLDVPVLAGTSTYAARLRGPGHVECTGTDRLVLGPPDGGSSSLADRVGAAFREADLTAVVAADMPRRRWEKLAINAGINPVTALARLRNGALVDGVASDLARRAAVETARVARAEGIDLPDEDARDALVSAADLTAANRSSMREDVEHGRRTEVDAINGEVVARGERHGVETPTNRTLAELVRAWEVGEGLRD